MFIFRLTFVYAIGTYKFWPKIDCSRIDSSILLLSVDYVLVLVLIHRFLFLWDNHISCWFRLLGFIIGIRFRFFPKTIYVIGFNVNFLNLLFRRGLLILFITFVTHVLYRNWSDLGQMLLLL